MTGHQVNEALTKAGMDNKYGSKPTLKSGSL
jgi:S-adenosylhomocysteine hydrolase